ncbi:amidohydrolase [Tomitella cavernea]|uniref:Amidohydrolase n=1 Tax=Tomitella cavernea TaxID=1387982 RepID=A0ABP9CZV1_9ACTN|nr:amidohydrolase [Tomitella cavernea]
MTHYAPSASGTPTADTVFLGGTVHTVDDAFSTAEAVAVADGRILRVGTRADVLALAGPDTETVELDGATLLPGFVEAHGHPTAEMVMAGPGAVDLRAAVCPSAEAVLTRLHEAVAAAPEDGWVTASGWDPLLNDELPPLSRALLTELSPRIPLSVMHYSGHAAWANDAAMDRLGITRDTPDPAGSVYVRDADGEPTGEGREFPAAGIIMGPGAQIPEGTFGARLQAALEISAAAGVTMTGDLAFSPDAEAAVRAYYAAGTAPVRMRAYEISGIRETIPHGDEADPFFRPVGVKIWSDGSPWIGNIATSFAYHAGHATDVIGVTEGHRGCANYTAEQLLELCRRYMGQGWQIACHVHGDVAVDSVLGVYETVQGENPGTEFRLRMEHCGSITPEQVRRAAGLGVTISFFPAHIYYYGEVLREFFGERADAWVPAGAAEACGMRFSLHNDPPVTPESPLLNMQTAVDRTSRGGTVLGAQYGVSVREAIRAQTIHAAWQLHSEHEAGSIEPGKLADFVLLSDDPTAVDPGALGAIRVLGTWIGGRRVPGAHAATA